MGRTKIGGGAPPILCRHGWLFLYHGVHNIAQSGAATRKLCYSAGAMVLSREHPNKIIYRSSEPVLVPEGDLECHGTVENVVFPSGIDRRDDFGAPDRFDIYYGMADNRIGVARLDVPRLWPTTGRAMVICDFHLHDIRTGAVMYLPNSSGSLFEHM